MPGHPQRGGHVGIGRRLGLSEGTVRTHLEHIYGRLQVSSHAAAVTRAFPNPGCVGPTPTRSGSVLGVRPPPNNTPPRPTRPRPYLDDLRAAARAVDAAVTRSDLAF